MKKHTIASCALAGLSILFLLITLLIGASDSTSILICTLFLMFTVIAFVVLSLMKKVNKMVILVPILLSLVFIGIFENSFVSFMGILNVIFNQTTETTSIVPPVLSLLLTGALVVGLVYALKKHRWAAILVIVILGVEIAVNIESFISLISFIDTIKQLANNDIIPEISGSYQFMPITSLAIISIYSSFIVYFIPILHKEKEEQIIETESDVKAS
ncbi:MAG: hypothetical protein J1F32_05990 [Erysipelotrichales bacterium]|nr:hypothetical protein [Erysipelotrichales bacterium]